MTGRAEEREILLALFNAREGRDDELNDWYTNDHLPEVVELQGILSAQRYAVPEPLVGQLPYRYATLYQIEGSSAEAMQRLFSAEFESQSESLDVEHMVFGAFVPLGDPIAPR